MDVLTTKQSEKLTNLIAFNANFPGYQVLTFKPYTGRRVFYVVPVEVADPWSSYIYSADSLENINGWLYGAVQAICGQLRRANND